MHEGAVLTFFAVPAADSRRDGHHMSLARAALSQNAARELVQLIVPDKVDGLWAKNRGKTLAGRHVVRKTRADVWRTATAGSVKNQE